LQQSYLLRLDENACSEWSLQRLLSDLLVRAGYSSPPKVHFHPGHPNQADLVVGSEFPTLNISIIYPSNMVSFSEIPSISEFPSSPSLRIRSIQKCFCPAFLPAASISRQFGIGLTKRRAHLRHHHCEQRGASGPEGRPTSAIQGIVC
jgi:hypothetical protein